MSSDRLEPTDDPFETKVPPPPSSFETRVPPPDTPFAETAPPRLPGTDPVVPVPAEPGLPEVPGYQILGRLGKGGMGLVFKAKQVKANHLVALKVVLPQGSDSREFRDRFRRE